MSKDIDKDIVTRLAMLKDIKAIKEYRNSIEPDTPYMGNPSENKLRENLERSIKDKNSYYYVVVKKQAIKGMFIYRVDKEHDIFHIDHISISKDLYGMGVSQMLMSLAEEEAAKNRIKTLQLVVHKDNLRGRRFYEKIGYEHIKTTRHVLTYQKKIDLKKFSLEDW